MPDLKYVRTQLHHALKATRLGSRSTALDALQRLSDGLDHVEAALKAQDAPEAAWTRCDEALPAIGLPVETKIHDEGGCRNQTTLKRGGNNGRLWFAPDDSIYVYYAPTHWRPIQ